MITKLFLGLIAIILLLIAIILFVVLNYTYGGIKRQYINTKKWINKGREKKQKGVKAAKRPTETIQVTRSARIDDYQTINNAYLDQKQEEEARQIALAEQKRKEEEARQKALAEQKRKEEEARQKALAELKRKEEEARQIALAELKRKEEEARQKALAEQKRKEEEARQNELEEKKRKKEARQIALAEKKRKEEEARQKALAELKRKEEEARQIALTEQKRKEEEARQIALAEKKRKEEEARQKALAEKKRKEEEALEKELEEKKRKKEARQKALAEKKRKEEEARQKALAEQKRKEEEARQKALAEQKRKEEEARQKALAEQKRKEEEARQKALAELKRKEEEARQKALAEKKRKEEELMPARSSNNKDRITVMTNPEYYKINSEHIAIIRINEQTQKAELDYIQIERIENDQFSKLLFLVDDLKEYLHCLKNIDINTTRGKLIIDSLKNKCYELDEYFRNNEVFRQLHQSYKVCLAQTEINIGNDKNDKIYQTYYGKPFEGLEYFSDSIKTIIDRIEERYCKDLIEVKEYLANKDNLKQELKKGYYADEETLIKKKNKDIFEELESFSGSCLEIPVRKSIVEYHNAIKYKCLSDPCVKAYSNKTVGYCSFNFMIGNEYKAIIDNNLGYGSSSYFLLTISYKDVKLTPYSKYVNYYYANKVEMHKYTQQAHLYDSEWGVLFQFVVDTYNLALVNPDQFIDKYFIKELNQMVDGLEQIARTSKREKYFIIEETEIYVANTQNRPIIFEVQSIKFYYFQLEKISGALEFIDSIEKIKELSDVQNYIDRIIAVNKYILTPSNERLEQIVKEISILENDIKKEEKALAPLNISLKLLIDNKIQDIKSGNYDKNYLSENHKKHYELTVYRNFNVSPSCYSTILLTELAEMLLEIEDYQDNYKELVSKIKDRRDHINGLNKNLSSYNEWKTKFKNAISIIEKYFDKKEIS